VRRATLATLLLLAAACERDTFRHVPAVMGTNTCKISVRDPRSYVLLRCGPPCGTGTVEQGKCPKGQEGPCQNRCDVYGDVEVCYASDRVVSLAHLDRTSGRLPWCTWPKEGGAPDAGAPPGGDR